MISYAFQIAEEVYNDEPTSFVEALKNKENEQWMIAMAEELRSPDKNKTWEMIPKPTSAKIVGSM